MKKLLIVLLCLTAWSSTPVFADSNQISLEMGIIDDEPTTPGNGKAPICIPCIYQDGYRLTFSSSHPEYMINMIENGVVVFSSVVPEGVVTFELPVYLSGEYTIQFISGRYCFYGLITL